MLCSRLPRLLAASWVLLLSPVLAVPQADSADEAALLRDPGVQPVKQQSASQTCCTALSLVLGNKISSPASAGYHSSLKSYWSLQEQSVAPSCIVTPENSFDVALTVKALRVLNLLGKTCKFAIRGGGHTPWAGSANIQGGITIDMRRIKTVTLDKKAMVASVGAGAIWGDVYRTLDAQGVAIGGGRGASIGVGGLLTGGGISYFAPRKGFVCDSIVNYEIVLANGQIVNANAKQRSDLWLALKGGSNNFGIVTRFDLQAFEQGNFWGGSIIYAGTTAPALLSAFNALNKKSGYDEYAALIMSLSWVPGMGFVNSANIEYTKPVVNPPVLQPFVAAQPQYANTMRISNLTDFTTEFVSNQPSGRRQLYITSSFTQDDALIGRVYDHFATVNISVIANVPNLVASLTLQPIPVSMIQKESQFGGNSLGISANEGPLVLCLLSFTWDDASLDAQVNEVGKIIHKRIIGDAKEKGLLNDWIYLNYAASWQDPIGGYGAAVKARLQAVSKAYDPNGVFQTLVPGGFKLFT